MSRNPRSLRLSHSTPRQTSHPRDGGGREGGKVWIREVSSHTPTTYFRPGKKKLNRSWERQRFAASFCSLEVGRAYVFSQAHACRWLTSGANPKTTAMFLLSFPIDSTANILRIGLRDAFRQQRSHERRRWAGGGAWCSFHPFVSATPPYLSPKRNAIAAPSPTAHALLARTHGHFFPVWEVWVSMRAPTDGIKKVGRGDGWMDGTRATILVRVGVKRASKTSPDRNLPNLPPPLRSFFAAAARSRRNTPNGVRGMVCAR
jgi:hypothetical protein